LVSRFAELTDFGGVEGDITGLRLKVVLLKTQEGLTDSIDELEEFAVEVGASVGGEAVGAAGAAAGLEAPSIMVTKRETSSSARAYCPIHSTPLKINGLHNFLNFEHDHVSRGREDPDRANSNIAGMYVSCS